MAEGMKNRAYTGKYHRKREREREGGWEGGELQSIRVTDCRSWRDKSTL